ncbi:MAG: helix-turn-helix transcriptional regulator [Solirubrobacterales bacterium]|nr:helix-turn-helix transcriptional regulator [Solirubrobacterales bacterium]
MTEAAIPGPKFDWVFARGKGRGRGPRRLDDLERFAALRHGRGGDLGFGPGPGFYFRGGRGGGRRRRGDVRVALLLLLAEEPRNGYQLMQEIEQRSEGSWRPSPGSVYPTLAQLEDEGLVRAAERDGVRVFEITDHGRELIAGRGDEAPPWASVDDEHLGADLKSELVQVAKAMAQVAQVGDEQQVARAAETLAGARRALYRILAEDGEA